MEGWIGFAGILMVIIGMINLFQGLIALFEDEYYVPTGSGFLLFDLTAWGWTLLIWGAVLVLTGFSLLSGRGWARWFTVAVVSVNFIVQLGFLGNSQTPLWSLTMLALSIIVLYALIVRWRVSQPDYDETGFLPPSTPTT
ncbi:MAG TPA: hypothetical protein VJ807_08085 [Gaiellaceae bacterium]|nr:hypothetical protein [Gaiellaceae bacterium]